MNDTQKRILSFLLRHEESSMMILQTMYRLSTRLIAKHWKHIDWSLLSMNQYLISSEEFIEEYRRHLNWRTISIMPMAPWSRDFLLKYRDDIDWNGRKHGNQNPYNPGGFSRNPFFDWTEDLIEEFRPWICWEMFQRNGGAFWTEKLVEHYAGEINWEEFSPIHAGKYSTDFILKHIGKTSKPYYKLGIIDDPVLVDKFSESICWDNLSASTKLPWSLSFVERWSHRLHCGLLSENPAFVNSRKRMKYVIEKWPTEMIYWYLSGNTGLGWDVELVEEFRNKWNWTRLSTNPSLPWTEKFIAENARWLNFGETMPANSMDDNHYDYSSGLSGNQSLPFTISLLEKYEDKWDYLVLLNNSAVWMSALEPHVDEEMVDLFFRITT